MPAKIITKQEARLRAYSETHRRLGQLEAVAFMAESEVVCDLIISCVETIERNLEVLYGEKEP